MIQAEIWLDGKIYSGKVTDFQLQLPRPFSEKIMLRSSVNIVIQNIMIRPQPDVTSSSADTGKRKTSRRRKA